jgi:RNA polymerase sigma-70 factor, ECF subfamily
MEDSHKITGLLREWSGGNRDALDALMPLVYTELRRQAARFLSKERRLHTLQPTALIHEAYLKLIDQTDTHWENRTQFFAFSATVMRHILVDYARTKQRQKRGGEAEQIPLEEAMTIAFNERDFDLLDLDAALNRLAQVDERQARLVELRYFSGLSLEDTAEVMQISRATAANEWRHAKVWLLRELRK